MLVTVPDPRLSELLASAQLLSETWPGADQEVKTLMHVLRIVDPSLEEVLAVGLVHLLTPGSGKYSAHIGLAYKRVVVTGVARRRENHSRVPASATRPGDVTWLEVHDLVVEGLSGLRMTG